MANESVLGGSSAGHAVSARSSVQAALGLVAVHDQPAAAGSAEIVLHLGELVPLVRARLSIGAGLHDEAILASLAAITSRSDRRERWRTAFGSSLGQWLAMRGSDLNTSLNVLMELVPRPRD